MFCMYVKSLELIVVEPLSFDCAMFGSSLTRADVCGYCTSTCKGKASTSTRDGPEGRPTNRPRYVARPPTRLVSRPTGHLVSRPKDVGADRGLGRGGSSSAAGNGDRFADDRGDICEYIDEGNRHVVRQRGIHGGRGGRSSVAGNGDRFADDRGDIGEYIDEGNRHVVRPRGIHGGRGGRSSGYGNGDQFVDDRVDIRHNIDEGNRPVVRLRGIHRGRFGSSAIGEGNRVADDYVEDLDEGKDELDMESSQRRRGSNIADTPPNESSQRSWIYPYQNGVAIQREAQFQSILPLGRRMWQRSTGQTANVILELVIGRFGSGTPSTPSTDNSYTHQSSVASSEEQEKVAQERERVAKELQQAAEERERAAEQRVKELEEQVKDIANMLKTLKPPPSPPPSYGQSGSLVGQGFAVTVCTDACVFCGQRETSLSFALMNVHGRAEGAKKHAAALRQLMMEIVSAPLSS
ncbi:hypothetical protein Tco_1219435 [Tanacetum coccineum]